MLGGKPEQKAMHMERFSKLRARAVCACLGAASMFALPGCELADGVLALVRQSAQSAIQEQADQVIGGLIEGVIGGVLPGGN